MSMQILAGLTIRQDLTCLPYGAAPLKGRRQGRLRKADTSLSSKALSKNGASLTLRLADLIQRSFEIPPQLIIAEVLGSELRNYALDAVGQYEIGCDFSEVPALSGFSRRFPLLIWPQLQVQ